MKRDKPGIRDYLVHAKYFILIWLSISGLLFRRGPVGLIRDLRRYPWLFQFLKAARLMNRHLANRGISRTSTSYSANAPLDV